MSTTSEPIMFNSGRQVKIKCQAMLGGLPHEVGVLIHGDGRTYESLLDEELVILNTQLSDSPAPAMVRGTVVKVNGANLLVELPRQVVSGGRRVWIPKTEIEP